MLYIQQKPAGWTRLNTHHEGEQIQVDTRNREVGKGRHMRSPAFPHTACTEPPSVLILVVRMDVEDRIGRLGFLLGFSLESLPYELEELLLLDQLGNDLLH